MLTVDTIIRLRDELHAVGDMNLDVQQLVLWVAKACIQGATFIKFDIEALRKTQVKMMQNKKAYYECGYTDEETPIKRLNEGLELLRKAGFQIEKEFRRGGQVSATVRWEKRSKKIDGTQDQTTNPRATEGEDASLQNEERFSTVERDLPPDGAEHSESGSVGVQLADLRREEDRQDVAVQPAAGSSAADDGAGSEGSASVLPVGESVEGLPGVPETP